jgi:hypothetical protein
MVGSKTSVAVHLKYKINPFLISIHCVAHGTNLAALNVAKAHVCKCMSKYVSDFVIGIAAYCKNSSNCKDASYFLKKQLNCVQKFMRRYQKVRWLSHWQTITTLCDSLKV